MARIFISAGHGGKQPGAVKGTIKEKDLTLKIANEATRLLRLAGHDVAQNRLGDSDCTPENAALLANKFGAALFIEFHINSFFLESANGTECYYHKSDRVGKTLAEKISAKIATLGFKNRGAKTANFIVLNNTNMTALLVESCFLSNPEDMRKFTPEKIAAAVVSCVLEKYPPLKVEPPKPIPAPAPAEPKKLYCVQVGAYSVKANAQKMVEKLKEVGVSAVVVEK